MTTMNKNNNKAPNIPIYFKLTKFVAVFDILLSLTDTIVTALIFFGDEQDFFKSLYYKVVKQRGIILLHSGDEVRWNQNFFSWVALVLTTMFNLIWFNSACYLLCATRRSYLTASNRLNYCRSWLLVSVVLLITYSVHIFTNGKELPIALLASLTALVYRVFAVSVVYGLFLHLEETVRPFFATVDGIYLETNYKEGRQQTFGFEHFRHL